MSVTIEFPKELEATLRERLSQDRQDVDAFVVEAVREKLSRSRTIDDICAPFANAVLDSGISDSEFDTLFRDAREETFRTKQSQQQ